MVDGKQQSYTHWERIMGKTLGAGPSVGHPFLGETLCVVPVANSSRREWTHTGWTYVNVKAGPTPVKMEVC